MRWLIMLLREGGETALAKCVREDDLVKPSQGFETDCLIFAERACMPRYGYGEAVAGFAVFDDGDLIPLKTPQRPAPIVPELLGDRICGRLLYGSTLKCQMVRLRRPTQPLNLPVSPERANGVSGFAAGD